MLSKFSDTMENPMKLSKSKVEESLNKLRSYSTKNVVLDNLLNCLNFVPKLK